MNAISSESHKENKLPLTRRFVNYILKKRDESLGKRFTEPAKKIIHNPQTNLNLLLNEEAYSTVIQTNSSTIFKTYYHRIDDILQLQSLSFDPERGLSKELLKEIHEQKEELKTREGKNIFYLYTQTIDLPKQGGLPHPGPEASMEQMIEYKISQIDDLPVFTLEQGLDRDLNGRNLLEADNYFIVEESKVDLPKNLRRFNIYLTEKLTEQLPGQRI